jgi:hypothetical protein
MTAPKHPPLPPSLPSPLHPTHTFSTTPLPRPLSPHTLPPSPPSPSCPPPLLPSPHPPTLLIHPPPPPHSPNAVKPKLPDDFEASTWSKLQAAVQAVHTKQHVATSLEELYRVSCFF